MELFVSSFLNVEVVWAARALLLQGFANTMLLIAIAVPLGLAGGLLLALLSLTPVRLASLALAVWIDLFRALPPLVLLVFVYGGLPFAGVELGPLGSVAVAFLLNSSAYYAEILRAGIDSVPRGQWEAARSSGLSALDTLGWVVLPQAVRNVLPDLVSNTLEVVKLTSIASVVAMPELLYQARQAQSVTYNASPLVAAALIYLILLWPLVRLLSRLEHRLPSRMSLRHPRV